MTAKARRVAVIGAGPSGAIATDALVKEQAFDTIRVFERRPGVGGTWIYTPHLPAAIPSLGDLVSGDADVTVPVPPVLPAVTPASEEINGHQHRFSDTPLHEHLHSNITPALMSYTQEPFPDRLSARTLADHGPGAPFRHHAVIREWVEGIFARGGHDKLVELGTTVERAEKVAGEWVLTLRKESQGRNLWWRETFDAVVVASGHYNIPWFPSVPGLVEYDQKFPGRILHSKHFRTASKFKGKRVVVVGGSISAHEVVHEIIGFAESPVYASLRGDPIPAFGWEPFLHPDIVVKKQISKLDPETGRVHFADGSSLDGVDHIVFGTGYTFSLPYLPHVQNRIRNAYRRLPGVYQHTWDIEDPTLTFVGMLGGGFTFRVYEWQAVAVARHLAGRAKALPSIPEQLEWERKRVAERGGGKDYYSIAPNYKEFFEFLRGIAGEPAAGTTGRVLPPFDDSWLEIWTGMVVNKIEGFQRKRKRAEEARAAAVKAKL
ncbi:FAD/NAD(P)-binding domain-containing protein [Durotheca rogersii]|uniref:FAD/NAD(P)-binding domain-containing protein n=1 Tax=Durotheca rogersii TaxID=419775 RepID=UPI00221E8DA7|nr:FAD/NAD(P)-binding domain-containing protein [Durotheca rogersii]KAI5865486.1 FAD/NAD(P)-binding domain-containing protein [Durotheca rogersii]